MASYISVPRDLSKVKTKVFMNLTKRQILCFGAGALIGVPVFFLLKSSGNLSLAALGMMAVMLPLFFLAMYEKDGQPLEVPRGQRRHGLPARGAGPRFAAADLRPYRASDVGPDGLGNKLGQQESLQRVHEHCRERLFPI